MRMNLVLPAVWTGCLATAATLSAQELPAWNSVVLVKAEIASGHWLSGSGVVVASGIVATNAHVLRGTSIWLVQKAGQSWRASILRVDEDRDLALLRVAGMPLAPVRLASADEIRVGQRVVAIGFPGGTGVIRRQGSLTASWNYLGGNLLQTDAPIAPGSSGGGLFSEEGTLLGITTFTFPVGPRFSFAVPVAWVNELLTSERPEPGPSLPSLVRRFVDTMSRDPGNAVAWEAFTRDWIRASPNDAEAWFARSHALDQRLRDQAQQGRVEPRTLEEGLRASRRALELSPRHARAWNNLGVALDLSNDFAAAEDAFRRALELDPGYGLAWLNLGGVYINRRNWGAAVRAFTQGLDLVPDDAAGWARRAYAESLLGRWPEAAAHYRIALKYSPWQLELWRDCRQACLKAGDLAGVHRSDERIAELSGGR